MHGQGIRKIKAGRGYMKKRRIKAPFPRIKAAAWHILWLVPALFFASTGVFFADDAKMLMGSISDCFFVSGTVFCGIGGLIFVSDMGLFRMSSCVAEKLSRPYRRSPEKVDFYTCKCRHTKKRTAVSRTLFFGIIFLAISAISCILWSLL